MKGEIDANFYCSRFLFPRKTCSEFALCEGRKTKCECRHRKWPTPEQYREEYGEEYPKEGAVYSWLYPTSMWQSERFKFAKSMARQTLPSGALAFDYQIVCACTPWGKPPDNWRPE